MFMMRCLHTPCRTWLGVDSPRWSRARAGIGQEMLFDEELTDAEVAEELLPITVQLGYVAAASGNAGASATPTPVFLGPVDPLGL